MKTNKNILSLLSHSILFFLVSCVGTTPDNVYYHYEGGIIQKEEIKESIEGELQKLEKQKDELFIKAANVMLEKALLELESDEKDKDADELIQEFTKKRFTHIDEKVLLNFYEKRNYKEPFTDVRERIKKLFESEQKRAIRRNYIYQLKKKYKVKKLD